jgi:hypothetical protein
MPKNTAPAANKEMASDSADVFLPIYTPPEAAEGAEGARNHGLREIFI